MMDEDMKDIPLSNLKSNNVDKKEKYLKLALEMSPQGMQEIEAPLSPGA